MSAPAKRLKDDPRDSSGDGASPRRRSSQLAYEYLRRGILRGEIAVGSVLAEGSIATELNMSRTPVRQALQQLLREGLVEVGHRRQMTVRRFPAGLQDEIFTVRQSLERIAVSRACEKITDDQLDELRVLLLRQRRVAAAGDAAGFIDIDEQFHLGIASSADLGIVSRFLIDLRAYTRMLGLEAISHPGRMGQVVDEHMAILDAMEARDQKRALAALEHHLDATGETLRQATTAATTTRKRAAS